MGGSSRKPEKPRPSYEDGKVRDPDVERMLRESEEDSRPSLFRMIHKALRGQPAKLYRKRS